MCAKRRSVRREMIEEEMIHVPTVNDYPEPTKSGKPSHSSHKLVPLKERKKPGRKKGWNIALESSPDYKKPAGASKGSVPMSLPERLIPEFCRLISAGGTIKRAELIADFCNDHPETSQRQATKKFSEMITKDKPACVPKPPKYTGKGRAVRFFLRPRLYHMLPEEDRPDGWEEAKEADEVLWTEQQETKARADAEKEKARKAMLEAKSGDSDGEGTHTSEMNSSMTSYDDDGEGPAKKLKTG